MANKKFLSKVLAVLMVLSMLCSTGVFADYGSGLATDPKIITVTSMLLNGTDLSGATEEAAAVAVDVADGIEVQLTGTTTNATGTITYLIAQKNALDTVPLDVETLREETLAINEYTLTDGTFDINIVVDSAKIDAGETYELRYAYSNEDTGTWVYQRYIKTNDSALASATVTTTKDAVYSDAELTALNAATVTFEDENYEIIVPRGTTTATFTITDGNSTSEATTVTMDASSKVVKVSVGGDEYDITVKYDDAYPAIYSFDGGRQYTSTSNKVARVAVQYGDLNTADELKFTAKATNAPNSAPLSGITFAGGAEAPAADKYLAVIGTPAENKGKTGSATSMFKWISTETNDGTTFKLSAPGTVYAKSTSFDNLAWAAIENLGWNIVGTMDGYSLYAKHFEADTLVQIPTQPITQAELDAKNATLTDGTMYAFITEENLEKKTASSGAVGDIILWNHTDGAITSSKDASNGKATTYVRPTNTAFYVQFDKPAAQEPVALNDIDDIGMAVLADSQAGFDAEQDAASADVTVEGNAGEEARGNHVIAMVLAPDKTLADVLAAIAADDGAGDLVAEGYVLAIGSATVDENGEYSIVLTLPEDVLSGTYNVVVDDVTLEGALEYTSLSQKVAAYNAIVSDPAAENPFTDVALIITADAIYTGLTPAGKAAVETSVLAKDAVAALPVITEPNPGEYVGLENIETLSVIIDTRIATEALNEGADAAELALVWDYILPEADAESGNIVAVAAAIYEDANALNATGKANVVAAISEQNYETKRVDGVQVSVKDQIQEDFAEAAFVELINNTGYSNINSVAAFVNKYIVAGVFEDLTSVSTTTLSTIVRDYTIDSYADFEAKVATVEGTPGTPITGGTEVVPSVPTGNTGITSGSMSNTTTGVQRPDKDEKPYKTLSEFTDAADAAWAAPALQMMLDRNILNGYEDDTIKPNNSATRQEVAKMLVQALSKLNTAAWVGFDDVPAGEWYYSYIATAANEGIIKGIGDNKFGTGALITREDLSVLIYRYLVNKGYALNTTNTSFTDAADINDYAAEAVNALTNAGVIRGYADGSFNPKTNATRAEIAQVIANVITIFGL